MKNLLLSFLALFPLLLQAQGNEARLAQVDVLEYEFSIEVFEDKDLIQATAWVNVQFSQTSKELLLDLVSLNEEGKGMVVSNVFEIQKPLELPAKYLHEGENLRIFLNSIAKPGNVRTFKIVYSGIPADGLIISKNRHGHRTFFGDNWPNRAHNWLPSVDHPSDKALVKWNVTVPQQFRCIANGTLEKVSKLGEKNLYQYRCNTPLPTKVMVIGIADFAVKDLAAVSNIPVSAWVFPEDSSKGFQHYAPASAILQTFMDSIAPYAYTKLANVQSKTRYGGMENASAIFYYESSVDDEIVPLLAHEIAHQWFGNMATEADWHHIWLSEGFATYFTDLYIEWSQGEDAFMGRMERERDKVIRYNQKAQRPIVDTEVTDWNRLLNPNSYEKGAWVLHMLRQEIGYAAFMKGIRSYYSRFGGKNALTADFQGVMEEVSGEKLQWFFDQWVYQGGHPELNVYWMTEKGGKRVLLEIEQVQEGPVFAFNLGLVMADKKKGQEKWEINVNERSIALAFDSRIKVTQLKVDPMVHVLADIKVEKK